MDLRATVRAAAQSKGVEPGSHPLPEELLSYHEDRLPADERARLVWHLAACSECTRAVLDMAQFPNVEPLEEESNLSEQDVEQRWERLLPRLRAVERKPPRTVEATVRQFRVPSFVSSQWFARAAAAVFLLLSASLILNVLSLRRSAREPRLNVPIVELAAGDASAERAEREEQIVRMAAADSALLVLTLVDPTPQEGYEIEIRDAPSPEGKALWSSPALERSPEGIFTLEIRRDFLPAGRYHIEITALEEGRRELVATYALRIEIE